MHRNKWVKWEITERGTILMEGREVGRMVFQERTCAKCGYVQSACEKAFIYPGC